MSEDNPSDELDELEQDADDMEERLEEHEAGEDDVEVPEPDRGEGLDASS